jgi:hypothetical protein
MMRRASARATVRDVGLVYTAALHAPASHHGGNPLLVLWLALACAAGAAPLAWVLRSSAIARAALRRCPACGSTGVRATRSEPIDLFDVRVHVQCGQCGAWRRLRARRERQHGHTRAVARDKRRIEKDARRLARRRAVAELRGFAAVIRAEIVSADDFLARTTPPRSLPHGD